MGKAYTYNAEQKKLDTKECLLYNSIHIKLRNRQHSSMALEVRVVTTFGGMVTD